jgi:hypothetical protein
MDNNTDEEVILNTQEETTELDTVDTTDESSEEIDWKAEALKAKEIADNQRIRAEKAEGKIKTEKTQVKSSKSPELSTMDIIALTKANIETEDIEEVMDYAKFKGISIADALKSSVVKATLSERAEQRNVSLATNTGGSKRGVARVSDETLVANAQKGNLPESDADIDRLMKAMMVRKN